jgi:hypothetical protein
VNKNFAYLKRKVLSFERRCTSAGMNAEESDNLMNSVEGRARDPDTSVIRVGVLLGMVCSFVWVL